MATTRRRRISLRVAGIGLVVVTLLVNAVVGFLLLATRAEVDSLARCGERYNREAGEARDARDLVATELTREEIGLWSDYLIAFEEALAADDAGDAAKVRRLNIEFATRIRTYRDDLRDLAATRDDNPYPDPDLCRRLVP